MGKVCPISKRLSPESVVRARLLSGMNSARRAVSEPQMKYLMSSSAFSSPLLEKKIKAHQIIFFAALVLLTATSLSASIDELLTSLETVIGGFPPAIESEAQHAAVVKAYEIAKQELDVLLERNPGDESLLFKRGYLQSMGHNMDYPKAWEGSEADLKLLLSKNPSHVDATLELASLYVNSRPDLAPNAELLFRAVQCFSDPHPNESAQSGLFFAFYYQGKIEAAYRQAAFLKATWPEHGYEQHFDTVSEVMKSSNAAFLSIGKGDLVASSCEKSSGNDDSLHGGKK
jgi:hypothetical protein